LITGIRNWLFDQGLFPVTEFKIPIISIGNLAVGGTGKTPHTEFLLSVFKNEFQTAFLSRGYKRDTNGFVLADKNSTSKTIGDEPFQVFQKFENVAIAVDEKRVRGVKKLLELKPEINFIVLDDAFQHRQLHAGFSILLTDFSNLYTRDLHLPAGSLREWKSGSKRAEIIMVTKCPDDFKPIDMRVIESDLKPETNQHLFFSRYVYDDLIPVFPESVDEKMTLKKIKDSNSDVLLVSGIVSPKAIENQLKKFSSSVQSMVYPDHYAFQLKDFVSIKSKFDKLSSENKVIVVTEKDAARIVSNHDFPNELKSNIYALPIRVEILNNQENLFIQKIKNYVVENSRNG
jgi:tetraacyldisaccharide 4'-kinase